MYVCNCVCVYACARACVRVYQYRCGLHSRSQGDAERRLEHERVAIFGALGHGDLRGEGLGVRGRGEVTGEGYGEGGG